MAMSSVEPWSEASVGCVAFPLLFHLLFLTVSFVAGKYARTLVLEGWLRTPGKLFGNQIDDFRQSLLFFVSLFVFISRLNEISGMKSI